MSKFKEILYDKIKSCRSNNFTHNYDFRRFGEKCDTEKIFPINNIKEFVKDRLFSVGFYSFGPRKIILNNSNLEKLSWLYDKLCDDESKNILVQVLAYRVLGEKHVKLPINTPEYWKKLEELDLLAQNGEELKLGYFGWCVNRMNLEIEGYPIEIFIRPSAVYTQMILQQYRCQTDESVIEVKDGDIAIDAGACYGDTACNFAIKAGKTGRVFSWEFMPENIDLFIRNMELNPEYTKQVELVKHPLWSSSGKKLYVSGFGPGASVSPIPPSDVNKATVVQTYSIDDLCHDKKLGALDFIKMDIEGAELEALKGAIKSIRQFKPMLAISIYHNIKDFWEIPQWIDSLGLGYKFYLRHFTIHAEETVLFAEVKRSN